MSSPLVFLGDLGWLITIEVVTRLARYLWQTESDVALLVWVVGCTRMGRDDVRALVCSMLVDARVNWAVQAFVDRWLHLGELATLDRDLARFFAITLVLRRSLVGEPRLFAVQVILVEGGILGWLLTVFFSFVDDELACLYGVLLLDDTFRRVEFDLFEQRVGILTQLGVLAVVGGFDRHSGSVWGTWLLQRTLCIEVFFELLGIDFEVPSEAVCLGVSLRAAIERTFADFVCQACHNLMQLGFAFEPFDAIGRWRTFDNGVSIDVCAQVIDTLGGDTRTVDGFVELVTQLAAMFGTVCCFARRWLELALGRDLFQDQDDVVVGLHQVFSEARLDIRILMVEVTVTIFFLVSQRARRQRQRVIKTRIEAFSDGVIAIIITILVLELKVFYDVSWQVLVPMWLVFLTYMLSFVFLGIYWNNHYYLFHACEQISGGIMWVNLHLLFWLSLVPFVIGWMGENHFAVAFTVAYGVVLLMAVVAFTIMVWVMLAYHGCDSKLAKAIGDDRKGYVSLLLYVAFVSLVFVHEGIFQVIFVIVALIWLVSDCCIEKVLGK